MTKLEIYLEKWGLPICDFKLYIPPEMDPPRPIERFNVAVKRALALDEYRKSKNTMLTKLIAELKEKRKRYEQRKEN